MGVQKPVEIRTSHRKLEGKLHLGSIRSKHLQANPLDDSAERDVLVYTPPGYDPEIRQYPYVLLLPALGSNPWSVVRDDLFKPNIIDILDGQIFQGACSPFLLVLPDATNRWGGSQYLDSASSGAYQSFLAKEVLPFVEQHFSTKTSSEGRAVVGRSSGGFGALRLAMAYPELFGAVGSHAGDAAFDMTIKGMLYKANMAFEQAGGIAPFSQRIVEQGPSSDLDHDGWCILVTGAAYAPNLDAPFPHIDLPMEPETAKIIPSVWERWKAQDPLVRLESGMERLAKDTFVYLDAGKVDEFGLQYAARSLAEIFKSQGQKICYEEFDGGHRGTRSRYAKSIPALVSSLIEHW